MDSCVLLLFPLWFYSQERLFSLHCFSFVNISSQLIRVKGELLIFMGFLLCLILSALPILLCISLVTTKHCYPLQS